MSKQLSSRLTWVLVLAAAAVLARSPAAQQPPAGEPIELIHQPAAHTDGDLMVFFRKSDMIVAGDIFSTDRYPVIDAKRGSTLAADRITQLVLEGKTLDQVKAAGVSLDYDGVYGATSGEWPTDMFVETAYREIKANTAPWKARLLRNVPAAELASLGGGNATPAARRPRPRPNPPGKAAATPWKVSGCSTTG